MAELLRISASQLTTFESCPRKWWFEKCLRLPRISKGYQTFGKVLHAVIERWLKADALGRDFKTGLPIELYPEGWDTVEEDGALLKVSGPEAALIKRLVEKAIADGVIQRFAGQLIEHEFLLPVIDGVEILGFIDLLTPEGVDDHKTSKDRKYLKQNGPREADGTPIPIGKGEGPARSPNCVADEMQMLTYGAVLVKQGMAGYPTVRLRHNQFLKDPKEKDGVKTAEAWVTVERLEEHWARIQAMAAEMLEVRKILPWDSVPGPRSADSCMAFGGCPFRGICGRTETPEMMRIRVDRLIETKSPPAPLPQVSLVVKGNSMDIFAKRPGGAVNSPAPSASPAVAVAPAPVVAPSPYKTPAPWARADCKACLGSGVNTRHGPCMICDSMQKKAGGVTSMSFALTHDAAGLLVWAGVGGGAVAAPAAPQPAQAVVAPAAPAAAPVKDLFKGRVKKKDQVPAAEVPQAVQEVPAAPTPAIVAGQFPKAEKRSPGRPAVGLTLLVDAAYFGGPQRPTVNMAELIANYGGQLALAQGASNYFELDSFKRRDMLAQRAAEIVAELGNVVVLASSGDPESKALIQALIPHAGMVITGTR